MNQKLKYLGILAILPVLTAALTFDYAEAKTTTPKSEMSKKLVRDKICGDSLCSEIAGGKQPIKTVPEKPKQKETAVEPTVSQEPGSVLKLSRANVPATIPLHKGFYDGKAVYFIVTDSSEQTHADIITKAQGWKVELAPPLANTPKAALDPVYVFTNGVKGDGIHGFQAEVFASTPAQADKYSAIRSHVHVTWKDGQTPIVLDSVEKIIEAQQAGKVELADLPVVLNMPQIVWPEGQMPVKKDKTLTDETPYGEAQILDIDTNEMKVTFIAHRGWGPDGRTVYYIVTDATPEMPATMMGTVNAPTLAPTIISPAAVDLFQFMNGITGSGPMGFQAGIAASAPGDENYSPLWRISMIGWKDPTKATVLENIGDINALKSAGKINVELARPMDSDHVVNCPFIDPFQ